MSDNATETRETTHWRGDLAAFTGSTEVAYGAAMHELELLEGRYKGETIFTTKQPAWKRKDIEL